MPQLSAEAWAGVGLTGAFATREQNYLATLVQVRIALSTLQVTMENPLNQCVEAKMLGCVQR